MNKTQIDNYLPYTSKTIAAIVQYAGGAEKLVSRAELKRLSELQREFERIEKERFSYSVDSAIRAHEAQLPTAVKILHDGNDLSETSVIARKDLKEEFRLKRSAAKERLREITREAAVLVEPILKKTAEAAKQVAESNAESERLNYISLDLPFVGESVLVETLRQIALLLPRQLPTGGFQVASPATMLDGIIKL